jgi:hypothetical protein
VAVLYKFQTRVSPFTSLAKIKLGFLSLDFVGLIFKDLVVCCRD